MINMDRYLNKLLRTMADNITSFWLVDTHSEAMVKSYHDYPVNPFGPTQLISMETINELMK